MKEFMKHSLPWRQHHYRACLPVTDLKIHNMQQQIYVIECNTRGSWMQVTYHKTLNTGYNVKYTQYNTLDK